VHERPQRTPTRTQAESSIRRRVAAEDPLGGTSLEPDTARRLAAGGSGGRALTPDVRTRFESAFGADFGAVNLHTDANAAQLTRDVQATAFTHGNNIYFSPGAYDPGSARGQHLLAHELTHVVQQGRGGGPAGGSTPVIGRADDPAETEAEQVAHTVVDSLRRQAAAHDHAGHDDGQG